MEKKRVTFEEQEAFNEKAGTVCFVLLVILMVIGFSIAYQVEVIGL